MRLIHYTNKDTPLTEIKYRKQEDESIFKPRGLWVSDEDDYGWSQWCGDENFRSEGLELAYEIKLFEYPNVLIIPTSEGIKRLTRQFHVKDRWSLDWPAIREQWDGLIITPYQWETRLDLECMWYYSWDCASGCIWNPAAIRSFHICQMQQQV